MKDAKKLQILRAIKSGEKYSRNNKNLAYLRMNGYIDAKGVVETSYVKATITLTDWGEFWLQTKEMEEYNGRNLS